MSVILEDICKDYKGNTVLKNIHLKIPPNKTICIKGKSGIGKSTLLNIIAGLEKPTSGKYYFNETNMSLMKLDQLANFRRNHIGYISQFSPMIPNLSAYENICVPFWFEKKINENTIVERIKQLTELFEVRHLLRKKISKLSGGEIQRIGIIRALLTKPQLIVADEPTGALDEEMTIKILTYFKTLNNEGASIILATHSSLVSKFGDCVYELTPEGLIKE